MKEINCKFVQINIVIEISMQFFFTNEDDLLHISQQPRCSNNKTPTDSKVGLNPFELIEQRFSNLLTGNYIYEIATHE